MKKILLADDEASLRFLITETLLDEGYDIVEAEDGDEAVEKLQEDHYDLIILDYMMPGRTGIEVCEWLRSNDHANQQVPVVLLTAKTQATDRELAMKSGISQYITKPFSPIQLLDVIDEWLTEE